MEQTSPLWQLFRSTGLCCEPTKLVSAPYLHSFYKNVTSSYIFLRNITQYAHASIVTEECQIFNLCENCIVSFLFKIYFWGVHLPAITAPI